VKGKLTKAAIGTVTLHRSHIALNLATLYIGYQSSRLSTKLHQLPTKLSPSLNSVASDAQKDCPGSRAFGAVAPKALAPLAGARAFEATAQKAIFLFCQSFTTCFFSYFLRDLSLTASPVSRVCNYGVKLI